MLRLGKSLQFDETEVAELAQLKYGAARTFTVLALLYPGLDLTRTFHEDHIFPRSLFTRSKLKNLSISSELIEQYIEHFDLLPNLQLLPGLPNVEKLAKLPTEWLAGPHFPSDEQRQSYLSENDLIGLPLGAGEFLHFYEGRRQRVENRLRSLLGVERRTEEPVASG